MKCLEKISKSPGVIEKEGKIYLEPLHEVNMIKNGSYKNLYVACNQKMSMHKKWSFPLRISSVNTTKSGGSYGFGHIY